MECYCHKLKDNKRCSRCPPSYKIREKAERLRKKRGRNLKKRIEPDYQPPVEIKVVAVR